MMVYAASGCPCSGRPTLATFTSNPNGVGRTKLEYEWPNAIAVAPVPE
jgi:hypothetical protein